MEIRKAGEKELDAILQVYEDARAYMCANGNATQWTGGYPQPDLVLNDIRQGYCHVCVENGEILGVFSWIPGPDPTYRVIEDGAWLDDGPYTVIHRVSVSSHRRGIASACFAYAMERCDSLRVDTHADNLPMQRSLEKNGFTRCGIIHVEDGSPRIAYQKRKVE